MKAHADAQSEENFAAVENWINDSYAQISDATSQPMPVMMQEVAPEEPSQMEMMMAEIQAKLVEYGFDQAEAEQWVMEKGEEWEALDQKQTEEVHAKAQADIQTAADYMKPIMDAMLADMKAQHDAAHA